MPDIFLFHTMDKWSCNFRYKYSPFRRNEYIFHYYNLSPDILQSHCNIGIRF